MRERRARRGGEGRGAWGAAAKPARVGRAAAGAWALLALAAAPAFAAAPLAPAPAALAVAAAPAASPLPPATAPLPQAAPNSPSNIPYIPFLAAIPSAVPAAAPASEAGTPPSPATATTGKPLSSAPAAPALRAAARARRLAAEADLAAARREVLAARAALAARLQAAYDALREADAEAAGAREELSALRRAQAEFRHGAASQRARVQELRALLVTAARAEGETPPAASVAALAAAAAEKLLARAAALGVPPAPLRLEDAVVVARDGRRRAARVLRLGAVCAWALGAAGTIDKESVAHDAALCGALAPLTNDAGKAGDASAPQAVERVAGPELPPPLRASLRAAAALLRGGAAHGAAPMLAILPCDPTGALAARETPPAPGWGAWLRGGGFFVYPIFLCGLLGLVCAGERFHYLWRTHLSDAAFAAWLGGATPAPEGRAAARPEARLLAAGEAARRLPRERRDEAMEAALLAAEPGLNRSLAFLAALAGAAPLLGLLGTVSGMIRTFAVISAGGAGDPRLLSGGIAEALVTTELGLLVAVPLLLAHAWLARAVERRKSMLESRALAVLAQLPEAPDAD